MTPESVERYYTTLTNTFNSEGTGEEACVVEVRDFPDAALSNTA
jgi:hypothetical protein